MKEIDSLVTIKKLRVTFAQFGLSISITAGNGRQFTSNEFIKSNSCISWYYFFYLPMHMFSL